jgi:tousled-like kinase
MMAGTTTSKSYNKKVIAPPANNKRIHDFFVSKKKPTDHAMAAAKGDHNNGIKEHGSTTQPHKHTNSTTVTTTSTTTTTTAAVTAIGAISAGAVIGSNNRPNEWSSSSSSSSVAAIDWETQCAKLQQQLQDKEEQLKAVSNNKTILHTALQSALASTKKELTQLQESSKYQQERMMSVMEDLLRWRSDKEAKDLRETLAADGARLGRIVYARTGMRAVESWEEGYATRDLEQRKEALKRTRKALDERQRRQQQPDSQPPLSGTGGVDPTVDPTVARLEAQEGREALHMHLETLRQQEQELLAEEQALNDEKGAHIRALKRVASEDSSRFRTRPKLHDRYVLDRLLGKGGFSEVWRGYDLQELREVAVKIHQLDPRWPDSKKENYTKHVTREYEIHRNVRHPRIVSLYDVFEIDANSFATVLECCKGTDLDSLLKSKKRLPERQARSILLQILSGMRYLSQPSGSRQGIIHYDLKPGNILFDEFGDAKITDFGLSKIVDAPDPAESMELTSQGAGTYWYLPPECFVTGEQVRISNKVDVWSIGVIFYQMLFGRRPFGEGKSQDKLLADHTMLNAHQVYMPDRPAVSDGGKEFLRQCLMYDQAFRPTIAQLCENPYVLQDGIVQADSSKKTD